MSGIAGFLGAVRLGDDRLDAAGRALACGATPTTGVRVFTTPGGGVCHLVHAAAPGHVPPGAEQPLCGQEGPGHRWGPSAARWIACDGEPDDAEPVRADLEDEGEGLTSGSPAEVLLRAVNRWGWEALERLDGAWAFALYDEADGALTLCRDALGRRPLLVHRAPEGLYFGSLPQAVFALRGGALPVDMAAVAGLVAHGGRLGEPLLFTGLEPLPAACRLQVEADGRQRLVSTRTAPPPMAADMGRDEAVAGVRQRLVRAVGRAVRTGEVTACPVLGGVADTALVAVAAHQLGRPVTAVSAWADAGADGAVEHLGVAHVRAEAPGALHPALAAAVAATGSPVTRPEDLRDAALARAAALAGCRVLVRPLGAVAVFGDGPLHHLAFLAAVRDAPSVWAPERDAWQRLADADDGAPEAYARDPDAWAATADRVGWDLLRDPPPVPVPVPMPGVDVLRALMLADLLATEVPAALAGDALVGAAGGVTRFPYLDRDLLAFAATVPTRHLVADGRTSALLRDAVRGVAPAPILDHRRPPVAAPRLAGLGFDGALPPVTAAVWDLVRRDGTAALAANERRSGDEDALLFRILAVAAFLDRFT